MPIVIRAITSRVELNNRAGLRSCSRSNSSSSTPEHAGEQAEIHAVMEDGRTQRRGDAHTHWASIDPMPLYVPPVFTAAEDLRHRCTSLCLSSLVFTAKSPRRLTRGLC